MTEKFLIENELQVKYKAIQDPFLTDEYNIGDVHTAEEWLKLLSMGITYFLMHAAYGHFEEVK